VLDQVHVQGRDHRLDIAPDRRVADDAEDSPGAVAQVEMDPGVIPEERFPVGAEGEYRRFRNPVLLLQPFHQQQESGEGKFSVDVAHITKCGLTALRAYLFERQSDIQIFGVFVQINHIAKIKIYLYFYEIYRHDD